ncbi:MAG: Crp/Fnr family transcriptional regulator [Spirochaetales bacterium]
MDLNLPAFERFAVTYQPGDLIFCEYEPGDSFYLIQNGRVQILKILGDIEKTVDILHPGEIFGEMAILDDSPRSASAVAVDDVKALQFNKANFEILMKGQPQIALKLLKLFSKRIYDQRRRFMILTLSDVNARIADVFIMLDESGAAEQSNDDRRTFQVSVDDVAHWAGVDPQRAREVLNHFVTQGRMEVGKNRVTVFHINELSRFVTTRRKS